MDVLVEADGLKVPAATLLKTSITQPEVWPAFFRVFMICFERSLTLWNVSICCTSDMKVVEASPSVVTPTVSPLLSFISKPSFRETFTSA